MPDTPSFHPDPRSALVARLTGPGGPFELVEEDHGRGPVMGFKSRPLTLSDIFARARAFRDKVFAVSGERTLSYALLFAQADRLAAALVRAGFAPGDPVALAVRDKTDWVAAFVAITASGGVAVLLDTTRGDDLEPAIARTACRLGVADTIEAAAAVAAATGRVALAPDIESDDEAAATSLATPIAPDDMALIAFTSGSSGTPKGVLVDHRGLVTGLRGMLLGGALQPAGPRPPGAPPPPCALVTSPLFHIGGYAQVLLTMMIGGKLVFAPDDDLARAVADHGVTALGGVTPALLRGLLDGMGAGADLASLRSINIQGAHLPLDLLARVLHELPEARITGGYGMTEANGSISVASSADLIEGEGRGFPLPNVRVRVLDDSGVELPRGQFGGIEVGGAMLALGYLTENGVLQPFERLVTGDVGVLEADGRLRVIDRRENCRWFGDRLVSCREIEAVVTREPRALGAHAAFSSDGVEIWVATAEHDRALRDRLAATLADWLPDDAGRVRLDLVRELALTASGKVRRPGAG